MIYIYKNIADDVTLNGFAASVQNNYLSNTMEENNVAETTASLLLTPITIDTEVLKDTSSTFGIVYIFVMLMYFFIIFYGQSIATNIASEKSSRVMEVMLPKVKPIYMMYGKIFATLTTGILQLLFVVATFVFCYLLGWINLQGESLFGLEIDFSNLSFTTILFFFVYFILGYTLYAILYASTGAVVSRMEDLPSVTMPVMMCVIAALFIGIKSMIDPTSVLVTISSYIPFFSPIVTYARMVVGEASWIEISVTIILITATIFIINKFASRLYVNGVMNYKGKVTFKDLFKMVSST